MIPLLCELIRGGVELVRHAYYADNNKNLVEESRFIREQLYAERQINQQLQAEIQACKQKLDELYPLIGKGKKK